MDLLTMAGMAIRPATQADRRFITLTWLRSGERAFVEQRWKGFDHLAVPALRVGPHKATRLALYNLEIPRTTQAIAEVIERGPMLVVHDCEQPTFVAAWACPEYRFTSHTFRHQGLSKALCESLKR